MDNRLIESSIKDAIDRTYRRHKIVFKHDIYLCLVFRLDNFIYMLELDEMPSLSLRLFDRLDGSLCSKESINYNELCLMKIVAADNIMIPTFARRYSDIDIDKLILDNNINDIADQIYYDFMGLEIECDILDMLPKVSSGD